jgi:hypothetical protein
MLDLESTKEALGLELMPVHPFLHARGLWGVSDPQDIRGFEFECLKKVEGANPRQNSSADNLSCNSTESPIYLPS